MKNNKLTFLKLYEKIDKNNDSHLTRAELTGFLHSIHATASTKEMNALLNYFDENNENHIGIKEFIDRIKNYSQLKNNYSLFDDEYKKIPIETINEKILGFIAEYAAAHNISVPDLFNSLDTNNNGSLSRNEMSNFFKNSLKLKLNQDEESSFYNFFDQNRDDRVNVSEFMKLMKPALEKEKSKKSLISASSNKSLLESKPILNEDLEEKLREYIEKKRSILISNFKLKEEIHNEGFVSSDDFTLTLKEVQPEHPYNPFSKSEIDTIVNRYCEKNESGNINYERFLSIFPQKSAISRVSRMSGFGKDLNRSKKMAKDIFGKISAVVKKENIKIIDAFKHFDLNGDGSISASEFKNAFKRMKLNYSEEDIDEIINLIGDNGKVDYKKFVDALKL